MPYKNIYFAKHQKHILLGSGSGRIRSFLGHPDPDPKKPDPRIRIRKNGPDPQPCSKHILKKYTPEDSLDINLKILNLILALVQILALVPILALVLILALVQNISNCADI